LRNLAGGSLPIGQQLQLGGKKGKGKPENLMRASVRLGLTALEISLVEGNPVEMAPPSFLEGSKASLLRAQVAVRLWKLS
jgi:hypothetical protein